MGEWMSAEAHVRVPDDADIGNWLHPSTMDRYGHQRTILAMPDTAPHRPALSPLDLLLSTAELALWPGWERPPEPG